MTDENMDTLDEMRDYIEKQVELGLDGPAKIVEVAVKLFTDDLPGVDLQPIAEEFVDGAIEEHMQEQSNWPTVTDCDRLDRAFAELENSGILCRQDFSDCLTCGHAEIREEMKIATKEGREIRGYTFFHGQDADMVLEEGPLFLAFGPGPAAEEIIEAIREASGIDRVEGSSGSAAIENAMITVAGEIVATLKRHGLNAQWSGSTQERIQIEMEWKRRR